MALRGQSKNPLTHEEMVKHVDGRFQADSERFTAIESALLEIRDALKPLPDMQKDITSTKEIVEAWAAVKTMGKFLKWFGTCMAGLSAIWIAIKVGASHLLR